MMMIEIFRDFDKQYIIFTDGWTISRFTSSYKFMSKRSSNLKIVTNLIGTLEI